MDVLVVLGHGDQQNARSMFVVRGFFVVGLASVAGATWSQAAQPRGHVSPSDYIPLIYHNLILTPDSTKLQNRHQQRSMKRLTHVITQRVVVLVVASRSPTLTLRLVQM